MSSAYEVRVNIALARFLSKLGFREVAERWSRRKRVDILLFYRGLRIAIEGSYDARDCEEDARNRIESGLADLGIAVWYYKEDFPQLLDEREIERRLEKCRLRIKIMAPGEDVTGTLMPFILKTSKLPPKQLVHGWLIIDIPLLKQCIDQAINYFASERKIKGLQDKLKSFVEDFSNVLSSIDKKNLICKELYDIFYKLYGLSVGDYREIADLIYGKASLALLLSSVFYECVANKHGLRSLKNLTIAEGSARSALLRAFNDIWKVNYQPIFFLAREALSKLPPEAETILGSSIDLACEISDNRVLLRRDFAGKVYHAIVGDWVVRKGFATYFTCACSIFGFFSCLIN